MDIVLDSRLVDGSYSLHSRPADFHERIINVLLRRFNPEAYEIEDVYSLVLHGKNKCHIFRRYNGLRA